MTIVNADEDFSKAKEIHATLDNNTDFDNFSHDDTEHVIWTLSVKQKINPSNEVLFQDGSRAAFEQYLYLRYNFIRLKNKFSCLPPFLNFISFLLTFRKGLFIFSGNKRSIWTRIAMNHSLWWLYCEAEVVFVSSSTCPYSQSFSFISSSSSVILNFRTWRWDRTKTIPWRLVPFHRPKKYDSSGAEYFRYKENVPVIVRRPPY